MESKKINWPKTVFITIGILILLKIVFTGTEFITNIGKKVMPSQPFIGLILLGIILSIIFSFIIQILTSKGIVTP